MKKKKAFTLAEVLITLTILGVVAAIAVPSLIRKNQDRVTITQVKRAYSMLNNAVDVVVAKNGPIYNWSGSWETHMDSRNSFATNIKDYLPLLKYCGSEYSCFPSDYSGKVRGLADKLSGEQGPSAFEGLGGKMILRNGMYIMGWNGWPRNQYGQNGQVVEILVDINGYKKPNRFGYDIFDFMVYNNGKIIPNDSNDLTGYGKGAAKWIMKHNNMDYKYKQITNNN